MHPFTATPADSVAAWGEQKLIRAIRRWLGSASPRTPFGIGDDCAVLRRSVGPQLITVDPVIFGRHFDATIPPRAVGAKLLKRNLSDIAAMGGKPTAAVLALTLDATVSLRWLEAFYRGLAACALSHRVALVGGDIAQAPGVLVASLTLLGEMTGKRFLTRTGGRIGDHIFVTGTLGNSLRSGHHHQFTPRLAEGAWLAGRPEVRAMMDVSDGLAKDLHALTPPGARPAIEAALLPRRGKIDLRATLADGEDYELVFIVAARADLASLHRSWERRFPRTRLTRIGRLAPVAEPIADTVDLSDYHGYEHLR